MKRLLAGLAFGLVLGGAAGFGAGIFAFPFIFPPAPANEQLVDKDSKTLLAEASFIHANPADPLHFGMGDAQIYTDVLHLDSSFKVGPGPNYHVYLVPLSNVTEDSAVRETMYIDLGQLRSFSGSQNYPLPAGIELQDYGSVVIWCEQFNVLISPAAIRAIP